MRVVSVAGSLAVLAGLILLAVALEGALPVLFWGTADERASIEAGRALVPLAVSVLLLGALLLQARGLPRHAIAAAACGLGCGGVALGFPETLFGWLAFAVLAPVALAAAVSALARPR